MARRGGRGFTLVEVSIVVVAVGILAAIAMVIFIRHRRTVRMTEAKNLISMIKAEQETYRAERGTYAGISNSADSFYPAANPGKFATAWGGPCKNCKDPQGWAKLPVDPHGPVMYGYATIAGVGASVSLAPKPDDDDSNINNNSKPDDDDSQEPGGNSCTQIAPTQPWFLTKAKGDTDGDGVASTVLALSCSNQLIVTNEGE
jgi:prepilin-type N-terminal cleavage/methylation domain-containing protein